MPKMPSEPSRMPSEPSRMLSEPSRMLSEPSRMTREPSRMPSEPSRQRNDSGFYPEPDALDLNTTLHDEVFAPGVWSPTPRPKKPCCCCPKRDRSRRLPNYFGFPQQSFSFDTPMIHRLDAYSWRKYHRHMGNVLVMFYESVGGKMSPETDYFRQQMKEAAEKTRRVPAGYAVVDCIRETDLCAEVRHWDLNERVTTYPFFTIFVEGDPVLSVTRPTGFDASEMRRLVELEYD